MIDCEKCYRLKHCGDNIYYCPFIGVNPCIRGKHTRLGEEPAIQVEAVCVKEETKEVKMTKAFKEIFNKYKGFPPFKPQIKPCGRYTRDWSMHHKRIFEMGFLGHTLTDIAKELGVERATVRGYVGRYRR